MASRWGCCLTEADQDRLIHRAGIGDTGSTRDLLHTTRGIVASLDGQVVLVTGATDGLGRALAVSLAEAGATVLIHGRDAGRITATTEDVRANVRQRPGALLPGGPLRSGPGAHAGRAGHRG